MKTYNMSITMTDKTHESLSEKYKLPMNLIIEELFKEQNLDVEANFSFEKMNASTKKSLFETLTFGHKL